MSDPKPTTPATGSLVARITRTVKDIIVRLWAAAIVLIILWATYLAVAYMIQVVFTPYQVPEKLRRWQARIPADELRSGRVTRDGNRVARAPLSHYHVVDRWFQPDPHNNCTAAECHSPLPHLASKDVRAFANMHATFMSCQMCHESDRGNLGQPAWINLQSGRAQQPPATLRLLRELEFNQEQIAREPHGVHGSLEAQLRAVIAEIDGNPTLEYILTELTTTEPGSPVWRLAVDQLRQELPRHARGEYGAKLEPVMQPGQREQQARRMAGLIEQFVATPADSPARSALHEQIHESVVPRPDSCLACHGGERSKLDFEALGYSPVRVAALRSLTTARMVQSIRQGQPFHLPGLMEPDADPASPGRR